MELPITESELELIMEVLKNKEPQLYNKLWSYKFNLKNTKNKE
jgi:hypothetical protein